MRTLILSFIVSSILFAGAPAPARADAGAVATALQKTVERVGQRQVEYVLTRRDGPTVVFEHGLGGDVHKWAKVFPVIAQDHQAFAYSRAGNGKSEGRSAARDGAHAVAELRQLLREKGLPPPYVLVGHSLGGLYMQWYERQYPDEVSALVLIDSVYPNILGLLQTSSFFQSASRWVAKSLWLPAVGGSPGEVDGIEATARAVLSLQAPLGKPVVVLRASSPMLDFNEPRDYFEQILPGARVERVSGGHYLQLDAPEAVIQAIRSVMPERAGRAAAPGSTRI
ncbi:alpha/beta hydrolase [Paucibacter sp. TC2R-5]|uniref:alpha/beta fold hydrolase n=1 Tax=Paucibacter sp. TC2R-5 TaxID=2893555 RepID=UPI0021E4FAA7|nr:alpha/beta hydrolase [Paucibacter sp. TC2R-5]MCV2361305.1 alpha/beta hydrolase [Paucibacter sp. TC2R-5]